MGLREDLDKQLEESAMNLEIERKKLNEMARDCLIVKGMSLIDYPGLIEQDALVNKLIKIDNELWEKRCSYDEEHGIEE